VKPRDVLVYLPPGYERDTTARYPVIYFHDGNNVFDVATSFIGVEWGVDETAEKLIRAGTVRPFIAVAVYNTPDRVSEYTPAVDPKNGGGKAADYARFLIEELKPFIDRVYRTRTGPGQTGVVGSSLGGIVSLYLGLQYPNEFGLVGCLSPAAWWADRDIIRRAARANRGARIWVDIGTAETAGGTGPQRWIDEARDLAGALRGAGYRDGRDLHYEEVAGAIHNEGAWAARVDRVLTFLLGPPERPKRRGT
jgi:predicted alpha/beta superfamily hydrolase